MLGRGLELTYTAWDLEAFALDCGYDGPPFRWNEERRFLLRCELDAAYFHLYLGSSEEWGLDSPQLREMFPTPRHAVEYIMETFPIVKRKDIKRTTITDENGQVTQPGTYITKDTILSIYDAMTESIRTGVPYQTRLDPPPGPPVDSEGNFIPYSEWTAELNTSHIHEGRDVAAKKKQKLVVDPVFPSSDLEKVLCASLLDFVITQPGISEDQYVDLMILAMQPANCRLLLTGDDRKKFDASLKAVLPELIADMDARPPWRLILQALQSNQSVSISKKRLTAGSNAELVRGKLPVLDSQFLSLVLQAGERLRDLQGAVTPDEALSTVVKAVQKHRKAAMSGVTSA